MRSSRIGGIPRRRGLNRPYRGSSLLQKSTITNRESSIDRPPRAGALLVRLGIKGELRSGFVFAYKDLVAKRQPAFILLFVAFAELNGELLALVTAGETPDDAPSVLECGGRRVPGDGQSDGSSHYGGVLGEQQDSFLRHVGSHAHRGRGMSRFAGRRRHRPPQNHVHRFVDAGVSATF